MIKPRKNAIQSRLRRLALNRDGEKCRHCNSLSNLEGAHVIPRCFGGRDILENVIILCNICHYEWDMVFGLNNGHNI